jgi:hypothetical protein
VTKAIAFSILFVTMKASGQDSPRDTLSFDTSSMKIMVRMDRETYLPGEMAQITLEVTNPGSNPVETLKPFVWATGCLSSLRLFCVSNPVDASNTATFAPGETKRIVLNSYDKAFDHGERVFPEHGTVGAKAGTYQFSYQYGNSTSTVGYTVAPTKLEADAVVRVHDLVHRRRGKEPADPIGMYAHVLALRSEGVSYICVSLDPVAQNQRVVLDEYLRSDVDWDYLHAGVSLASPLKRLATSAAPVVSLSASADHEENLAIQWTAADGKQGEILYTEKFPARPSDHR